MADVCDVHHVPDAVSVPFDNAFEQVLEQERPIVADMLVVVDRGSARIQTDFAAGLERDERAQRARVVVVERERSGHGSPDIDRREGTPR